MMDDERGAVTGQNLKYLSQVHIYTQSLAYVVTGFYDAHERGDSYSKYSSIEISAEQKEKSLHITKYWNNKRGYTIYKKFIIN